MKYLEGFRNPGAARTIRRHIDDTAAAYAKTSARPVHIMEVCGTHTMAIARHGIRDILPPNVDLISGPGCPVCVTDMGYIDTAIALARQGVTVVTFGDMLHVPGSESVLSECRAAGGRVEVCYSPTSALELARRHPEQEIVFLAIGFETTICPVISLVDHAIRDGITNLSLLTAFKLVPPALQALLADPDIRIDAFLCPAHVSAIIGSRAYEPFAHDYNIPCVVAGFEPLDILLGIEGILRQRLAGEARVDNQYDRVVKPDGNPLAQALIDRYLEPVDAPWRGIGTIPASGLGLRSAFTGYDAARRFDLTVGEGRTRKGCRCGDVIKGKIKPSDCPLFASVCTPDNAIGPCMVSTEGTCAAHFKYSRLETASHA